MCPGILCQLQLQHFMMHYSNRMHKLYNDPTLDTVTYFPSPISTADPSRHCAEDIIFLVKVSSCESRMNRGHFTASITLMEPALLPDSAVDVTHKSSIFSASPDIEW